MNQRKGVRWKEIPGTNGNYFASSDGRIKGRKRQGSSGGELKPYLHKGYAMVNIHVNGKQKTMPVHRLVLEAFVGPGGNFVCRHLDGNPANNNVKNLAWGTRSENSYDAVRHGTHPNMGHKQTSCIHGHEFTGENTIIRPDGRWECRICNRRRNREYYWRQKEQV